MDIESVRMYLLLAFQFLDRYKDVLCTYFLFTVVMFCIGLFFVQFDLDSDMYKFLESKYGCTTAMFMEWDRIKRHTRNNFEKGKLLTDDPIEQHLMKKMINIRYKESIKKNLLAGEFKRALLLARDCVLEMAMPADGKERLVFAFTSKRQYMKHINDQKFTKFAAFRLISNVTNFEEHRLTKLTSSCYLWIGDSALHEQVEGVSCEVIHAGDFAIGTDITKPVQMDIQDLLDVNLPEEEPDQVVVLDGRKYGVTNLGPDDADDDTNVLALIQKRADKLRNRGRRERAKARRQNENDPDRGRPREQRNRDRRRDRSGSEDAEQHVMANRVRLENARQKIATLQKLQAMGSSTSVTRVMLGTLGY